MNSLTQDIAATAARLVVEDGMEYGMAKRQAVKQMGLPARTALPSNDMVEDEVRSYIEVFCPDTQAQALAALRQLAAEWMARLTEFRPHLSGAVWRGTATAMSDIYLQLFCDDSKSAEIRLIDHQVRYEVSTVQGFHGEPVDALTLVCTCPGWQQRTLVHLMIYDHDDLRGALKPDAKGRSERGDLTALKKMMKDVE